MPKNTMGQFISALRRAKGLTQQEVADHLCVSNKAVSRWERDECAPDISVLPALAELFSVTCDELLRGERNSTQEGERSPTQKSERQLALLTRRRISRVRARVSLSGAFVGLGLVAQYVLTYALLPAGVGFAVTLVFLILSAAFSLPELRDAAEEVTQNELFEDEEAAKRRYVTSLAPLAAGMALSLAFGLYAALPPLVIHLPSVPALCLLILPFALFLFGSYRTAVAYFRRRLHREARNDRAHVRSRLALWQGVLFLAAAALLFIAPYFEFEKDGINPLAIALRIGAGIALLGVVILCIAAPVRNPSVRQSLILPGLRGVFCIPSFYFFQKYHTSYFSAYIAGGARTDTWNKDQFIFAVAAFFGALALFALIGRVKSGCTKSSDML